MTRNNFSINFYNFEKYILNYLNFILERKTNIYCEKNDK